MPQEVNDTRSIKINELAHTFLRYTPAMGIQMQDFASDAIINEFKRCWPEMYEQIVEREHITVRMALDQRLDG